jgi:hypothetical protein
VALSIPFTGDNPLRHIAKCAVAVTLALAGTALAEEKERLSYEAGALYAEYTAASPMDVMNKFMGKAVDLTGKVSYVGKAPDHVIVKLETKQPKKFVMLDLAKGSKVKTGQQIALSCDSIGGADENMMQMVGCSLAKKK